MSKLSIVERITSGALGGVIALLNTLITLITFITVDAKSAGESLNGMDSLKLIYVLYSLAVGLITYGILFLLKVYVQKVILESQNMLNEVVVNNSSEIESLKQRYFISAIISFERLPHIYPDRISGNRTVRTEEWVLNEISSVRNNALINRKKYGISLDTVEDELERLYGPYYPLKKTSENEPDSN